MRCVSDCKRGSHITEVVSHQLMGIAFSVSVLCLRQCCYHHFSQQGNPEKEVLELAPRSFSLKTYRTRKGIYSHTNLFWKYFYFLKGHLFYRSHISESMQLHFLLTIFIYLKSFFFFWPCRMTPGILVPQFSSLAQSCLTLCNSMDWSVPGLPVHDQLMKLAQTHVYRVGDAIQPPHPLSSPSPTTFNLPQHQGLLLWISSSHQVAKVLEFQLQHQSFQWIFRTGFL